MLDEAVIGGKLLRGCKVVYYLTIVSQNQVAYEDIFKASVLGWCIELVSDFSIFILTFFLLVTVTIVIVDCR
jgi:Polyprenyl synthetase